MVNVLKIDPRRPVKDMFGMVWPAWQYFGDPKPRTAKYGRGGRRNRKARRAGRAHARWRFVTTAEDLRNAARGAP